MSKSNNVVGIDGSDIDVSAIVDYGLVVAISGIVAVAAISDNIVTAISNIVTAAAVIISNIVVTAAISSSRNVCDERDDDDDGCFCDDGNNDEEYALSISASEIEYVSSFVRFIRELMVNVFDVSPFVADEIDKISNAIGRDQDVTWLYETVTNINSWRLAVSPYAKPSIEHAMFGAITYVLHCPLDRMVYSL